MNAGIQSTSPLPGAVSGASNRGPSRVAGFRTRLLVTMMLVVSAITALTLYIAERKSTAEIQDELLQDFRSQLAAVENAQAVRHAALVERCRTLVDDARIHAALEDNALDLLYPSAADELRDVMAGPGAGRRTDRPLLRARFFRFLDPHGRVIPPTGVPGVALGAVSERELRLPALSDAQQVGYILTPGAAGGPVSEVIATPIISTETGEVISALVLGFKPFALAGRREMRSGIWLDGRLWFASLPAGAARLVRDKLAAAVGGRDEGSAPMMLEGSPQLMFFKRLNPGSQYPPAYDVSLYPLSQFAARERRLRVEIAGMGLLLLAGAFLASRAVARRLSAPVESLAAESERSARFSADASHQLKTPVTVLRAGLEELLTRENLTQEECDSISALIHQTYRLSSLIEDLLLLSRMDSGRLRLAPSPVDLSHLIAAAIDDVSAAPDEMSLTIETDVPPNLEVVGERRYTAIILQNLLENARKYNRPGGRIRIGVLQDSDSVLVRIANTGRPIAPAAQANIFERFHRGTVGEDLPGYGLGLNLARELAFLHNGELRLVRSDAEWTEFELKLPLGKTAGRSP